jgi:hypothetical protein
MRGRYALASAAIHGRSGRGSELVLDVSGVTMQARLIGLLLLERLCDRDEEMDHLSSALVQLQRFEHAANFGGTSAATTDTMAQ